MNLINNNLWKQFVGWLETRYYDRVSGEWSRNVSRDDYLNSRYDFGNSYSLCVVIAGVLQSAGHKVIVTGAEEDVMEKYRTNSIGLDWLLVDDRYVFDPWGYSYESEPQIIYDLQNRFDQLRVEKLFPPIESWEPSKTDQTMMEIGVRLFKMFTLPQRAVDQLLGGETEP